MDRVLKSTQVDQPPVFSGADLRVLTLSLMKAVVAVDFKVGASSGAIQHERPHSSFTDADTVRSSVTKVSVGSLL